MSFVGKFGHLSSVDAAIASLLEIEKNITDTQLKYLENNLWDPLPAGYDNLRLWFMVLELQKVILKNGASLGFSKLPYLERKSIHA